MASGLAAAQTPDPAYTPLNKAYESLRARNYEDAIASFLKAIAAAPARPAIRKDLAYAYLKIGENEAARDQFREAMRLDPKDFHVALEYAFLANETKQQAQARRVFDRIRKTGDPESRATAEQRLPKHRPASGRRNRALDQGHRTRRGQLQRAFRACHPR